MMEWMQELEGRIKRKNQVLFTRESLFLQELSQLISVQNRRTLVLWALELAKQSALVLMERYPEDARPIQAVHFSEEWSVGHLKMPAAKQAILQVHAMAKELSSLEDIALCHAVGQACGVVHTPGHALGYPMYELTAIVRRYRFPQCESYLLKRRDEYRDRLLFWQKEEPTLHREWAKFLIS